MKIQPLGDRVVVKSLKAEEKTKGGIVIPDTAKERPMEGKIMAVGKGNVLDSGKIQALEVKAGDRVLYGKYNGSEVNLNEEDLLIMREEDILAIVKS